MTLRSNPDPGPDPEVTRALTALADLLERENMALTQSDFRACGTLAAEKRTAIAAAEAALDTVGPQASPGKPRSAPLRRRLDLAIERNRMLLQQAIDTQQRVISTVVGAIERPDEENKYPTQTAGANSGRASLPMAFAVNA